MSEEYIGYINRILVRRLIDEKSFEEVYVHPDPDSIVSASLIIRIANLAGYEIGVAPLDSLEEVSDRSIIVGFSRPRTLSRGLFIGRDRESLVREDRIVLLRQDKSISSYISEAVKEVYPLSRELRSIVFSVYLYTLSEEGMLYTLEDEKVREGLELFGVDVSKTVLGLKILGYYDETYIERNLLNTIDPFIPGVTGRGDKVREIMSSLGEGRGRTYLEKVVSIVNTVAGRELVKIGNKPYFERTHPFVDPYETVHCLNIMTDIDPVSTVLYIATGLPGIAMISLRCRELFPRVVDSVNRFLERSGVEIVNRKIDNTSFTEIVLRECVREVLYETYLVLRNLRYLQDPVVFRCGERYLVPVKRALPFSRDVCESLRGMFLELDDIKKIPGVLRLVEDLDRHNDRVRR